jgi:Rieske Fe-S protein
MEKLKFENNNKNSRRIFLKLFSSSIFIGVSTLAFSLIKKEIDNNKELIIPINEISFKNKVLINNVIIIQKADSYLVLENRCTHLGCKLKLSEKELVCPCHGSKFDFEGKPIKGPAIMNLKALKFTVSESKLIIEV